MTPAGPRPNPPSQRPHPPTVPPRDSKSSLYEAAVAAVQERSTQARARAERRPPPRRRLRLIRIVALVGLAGLVLLFLRPSWVAGPDLPAESPGVAAAAMRLVLLRERDAVRTYLERAGRLPGSLAEAGSTASGVEYRRSGEGFLLSATVGDSLLVLRDSDSTATFLGQSLTRLKNRGREQR